MDDLPLAPEVIALIMRTAHENPVWSRRRIAAELAKLGHDAGKDTVAKYMPKRPRAPRRPPSTTWGTFLRAHLAGTIAIDFLTVPTVTFNVRAARAPVLDGRRGVMQSRVCGRSVSAKPAAVAWAAAAEP